MKINSFDHKYVRIFDLWGNTFEGLAITFPAGYGLHVFDRDEESIRIEDYYIFASDIKEIKEIEVHGTVELASRWLTIRRYEQEDAKLIYEGLGRDEEMFRYTGWNPYATAEMAEETVREFIDSYDNPHFYGWALELEGILVGTIGAYDYDPESNSIEVGISIIRSFWGHGYATEALTVVLKYLTENEMIAHVTAWCASDNLGSRKAMEKAGMKLVRTEAGGLEVDGEVYDKFFFEYSGAEGEKE